MGNSRTNHECKAKVGYHTIADFALNWYRGLTMMVLSIFELAKPSLYEITRYRMPKIKLKVKHYCMFAIFSSNIG